MIIHRWPRMLNKSRCRMGEVDFGTDAHVHRVAICMSRRSRAATRQCTRPYVSYLDRRLLCISGCLRTHASWANVRLLLTGWNIRRNLFLKVVRRKVFVCFFWNRWISAKTSKEPLIFKKNWSYLCKLPLKKIIIGRNGLPLKGLLTLFLAALFF